MNMIAESFYWCLASSSMVAVVVCMFCTWTGDTARKTNVEAIRYIDANINDANTIDNDGTFGTRQAIFVGAETPEEQETSPALALIQGPLPLPMTYNVTDRCPFPQSIKAQQHGYK